MSVWCSLLSLLPLKMDAGEMLITPGHEAGRVYSSKAELGAAETSKRKAESVPLRGSPTTEGRCLNGDTLSTPFHYMRYTTPPPVSVYAWSGSVCICFCKHSKMRGSCPQWPCIGRYFSLHDVADLKDTPSLSLCACLYFLSFWKQCLLPFTSKISCWMFVLF